MVSLNKSSGAHTSVAEVANPQDQTFCASGSLLLNSEGDVIEVATVRTLRRLNFLYEQYE